MNSPLPHVEPPRLPSGWSILPGVFALSAVLLGTAMFLHLWRGVPIGDMTRDPSAVAGLPLYTGFLSQAGLLFWSASAVVCHGAYVAAGLAYLCVFRAAIARTEYVLLFAALLAFAASLLLDDRFPPHGSIDPELYEDGAKLIGIISWLAYFFRSGVAAVEPAWRDESRSVRAAVVRSTAHHNTRRRT